MVDPCLFRVEEGTLKATFEITSKCNYSCEHCCTNSNARVPDKLASDEVKKVVARLHQGGVSGIYISGGEPFARQDIIDILRYTCDLPGIRHLYLASNGSLIKDAEIRTIKESTKISAVLISVDGHTADLHNRFRIASDGYRDAVEAVRRLVSKGVTVRMGHVIWRDTLPYLRQMADLAVTLGVDNLYFGWLVPVGRAYRNQRIDLQPTDYLSTADQLKSLRADYEGRLKISYNRFETVDAGGKDCPGGIFNIHVLDDGRISPCSWIAKMDPQYTTRDSLAQVSLDVLMRSSEMEAFRKMVRERRERFGAGCPAVILAEEGTYFASDPLVNPDGLYFRLRGSHDHK